MPRMPKIKKTDEQVAKMVAAALASKTAIGIVEKLLADAPKTNPLHETDTTEMDEKAVFEFGRKYERWITAFGILKVLKEVRDGVLGST